MFTGKYGPFASIIAIVAFLTTVFSVLLLKAVGRVSQWTFLAHDSPPFLVTAGARALAVALIALTFIFIDKSNYGWFGAAAAVCGTLMIVFVSRFDFMRKAHICKIPILNEDGSQKKGWFGSKKFETVVIGSENNMKTDVKEHYKQFGGGSLCKFLSGFGKNEVNNAAAIWDMEILAKISSRMTMLLIGILLCGVMALYLAASAVEVHVRPDASSSLQKESQ